MVALGVFDGVHCGHRRILEEAVKKAREVTGTSIVVTFWPHPQGEEALNSLAHRLQLIGRLGIQVCIVINFNRLFAITSPRDFIEKFLCNRIGARYLFVGKNFRFGKDAAGSVKTLKQLSGIFHYRLLVFPVSKINHHPVSSTLIRALIKKGKLADARRLLLRPVSVLGTVIKGISRARRLGFPTANLNPHHEVIPPPGVYAVEAVEQQKQYRGISYIGAGKRGNAPCVEVHLFDFKKDIYGKELEVYFIKKIRNEKYFPSSAFAIAQINRDVACVKRMYLRSQRSAF